MSVKPRTRLSPSARIDQLLDVAKQMILRDGLQAFTMEALARSAVVSSPLVYNYFSSRQALLQSLLEREYKITGSALFLDVMNAKSFEEVIRMFVANNFDHHAPGNIVHMLLSQPEIADIIKPLRKEESVRTARYLVENTAKTYKLTIEQAQLAITMSSGASIAAAEWATMAKVNRNHALDMVVSYIKAGMSGLTDD